MLDLTQRLQNVRQYTIDGIKELSEHPAEYLLKSGRGFAEDVGNLVKDYWDAGVAIAAGLAWTPQGENLYGDYQPLVGLYGPLVTLFGIKQESEASGQARIGRNMFAGMATFAIATDMAQNVQLCQQIPNKFLIAALLSGSILGEYFRKNPVTDMHNDAKSLEQSIG